MTAYVIEHITIVFRIGHLVDFFSRLSICHYHENKRKCTMWSDTLETLTGQLWLQMQVTVVPSWFFLRWLVGNSRFFYLRKGGDRGRGASPMSIQLELFFSNTRYARSLNEAHRVAAWSLRAWLVWAGRREDGWWGMSQDYRPQEAGALLPVFQHDPLNHDRALCTQTTPYGSAIQISPKS